jgi:hypothetical protein
VFTSGGVLEKKHAQGNTSNIFCCVSSTHDGHDYVQYSVGGLWDTKTYFYRHFHQPYEVMQFDCEDLVNGSDVASASGSGQTGHLGEPQPKRHIVSTCRPLLPAPLLVWEGSRWEQMRWLVADPVSPPRAIPLP